MSSHHFVKEGQEPALVIADFIDSESLSSLLEWAPSVIVFENALDFVVDAGLKADVVVTTIGNVEQITQKVAFQAPVKILSCNTEGEFFETAMSLLISLGQTHVNVCVGNAATFKINTESFSQKLEISLIDEQYRWLFIQNGHYEKWLPRDTEWIIESALPIQVDSPAIYKEGKVITKSDGVIGFQSEGTFWIGEPLK
jgi:hypothetical protein